MLEERSKEFLLKVNADQFKRLFPQRSNKFLSEDINGNVIIVDTLPVPQDVILCDYGCNRNLYHDEYFYLLMIDEYLCQGTVCKDCYEKYFREIEIKEFEEMFSK